MGCVVCEEMKQGKKETSDCVVVVDGVERGLQAPESGLYA